MAMKLFGITQIYELKIRLSCLKIGNSLATVWHKYVKDMFDNEMQSFYTFAALKEKFDLPSSDFLKYLSILNSIPSACKRLLKMKIKIFHQMKNLNKC